MRSAGRTGNGFLVIVALLCLPTITMAALWMTQPKEWQRGPIVLGRARCTTPCRLRGGFADLLRPQEAPHCLCGRARTYW